MANTGAVGRGEVRPFVIPPEYIPPPSSLRVIAMTIRRARGGREEARGSAGGKKRERRGERR